MGGRGGGSKGEAGKGRKRLVESDRVAVKANAMQTMNANAKRWAAKVVIESCAVK